MAGIYETLYSDLLQPAYERLRGRATPRLEQELAASQWRDSQDLAGRQWRDLARLLEHARKEVPFYARCFAEQGLAPAELARARDLTPLPVVDRVQMMAEPELFQARRRAPGTFAKATGGTSGRPLRFLVDPLSDQWRLAVSRRGYAWAGCRPGGRQVHLWSGDLIPPGRMARLKRGLHRALQGQVYVDSFHLGPAEMDRALALISGWRPATLVAFTSAAEMLARHARGRRWRAPASLRAVITGAESLYAHQRQLLEEVFACPVFETYGSREFMLIAGECALHQGLHVSEENLFVELLKDGRPAAPGEVGEVVVTDLHNFAQPFIRYRNGDLAVWAEGACPCGRGLKRLARLEGRILEVLRSPGGRELTGTFFPHLLKDFPAIRAYQVEQDRLDHLVIRLVLAQPLAQADQARILGLVAEALPGLRPEIRLVDEIPLTAGGKRRVTIGLATPAEAAE
jgi:phenylacetate-CoA ligase